MEQFRKQQDLKKYFDSAYGFAVFPNVAKVGFGIGGAGGNGDVYTRQTSGGEKKVGESTMMQLSFGFQFGGQVYSEIVFFETEKDFKDFTSGNFEFGADANVVALSASASAKASTMGNQSVTAGLSPGELTIEKNDCCYTKGLAVFTITLGGLMYQATVSGQKFNYKEV